MRPTLKSPHIYFVCFFFCLSFYNVARYTDTFIRYTDHLLAVFSVILALKPSLNWAFFRVNCYIFTWLDEFPAVYFKAKSGRVRQNSVESEKRDEIPFLVGFFSMKRWILNWFFGSLSHFCTLSSWSTRFILSVSRFYVINVTTYISINAFSVRLLFNLPFNIFK